MQRVGEIGQRAGEPVQRVHAHAQKTAILKTRTLIMNVELSDSRKFS